MNPIPPPRAGLVSHEAPTPVVLPLKGVLTEFVVTGGVAEVTMVQAYLQENARPLNCRYLFPLPVDAAVYSCEIEVDGRRIVARVEEKERALALAREAWQAGHRSVVIEPERENLFTLSLGNVQPGDFVEVRLRYVQPLRRIGETLSLEIPFNPGVRYIPGRPLLRSNRGPGVVDDTDQVPDASRICPPRIPADHPDAAFVEVQGRIEAALADPASITSVSHEILVTQEAGWARVGLRRHGELLDLDLVLRWNEPTADRAVARAWTCRRGAETYALLEIRAPQGPAAADAPPRDVYFLVDRSASVGDDRWAQAIVVMQSLVAGLRDADRVMLTLFNSAVRDFAEAPRPKREVLADPAFGELVWLGTRGGTELVPAFEHVLDVWRRHSGNHRCDLVVITDAAVGNDARVTELVQRAAGLTVHTVGIDPTPNDALLHTCARMGSGTFHSLHPRDDVRTLAGGLGSVLGPPVWRDFEIEGPGQCSGRIPDLHAGQVYCASLRLPGSTLPRLRARDATGRGVVTEFDVRPAPGEAPYHQWVRDRIRALLEVEDGIADAVALSREANLICSRTAFVAWDETNRVPIAGDHLVQPNLGRSLVDEALLLRDGMTFPRFWGKARPLEEAVRHLSLRARITTGFDRRQRREVLSASFRGLHQRLGIAEGGEAFERLLDWAEAAGTDRESEDRFAEVQALVAAFEQRVESFELRVTLLGRWMGGFESELSGALERLRGFLGKPPSEEFVVAMDRRLGRVNGAGKHAIEWQQASLEDREQLRQWLRSIPERLPAPAVSMPASTPAPTTSPQGSGAHTTGSL